MDSTNKRELTKKIAGTGIFMAIVIALQFLANYVSFGPISITLSLIPIVVGSIMFGPLAGLALGLADGAIILLAPSTSIFLSYNAWATVLIVLVKTSVAGLISGLIFKFLNKNHFKLGVILASISAPIVNTGLFAVGALIFYLGMNIGGTNVTPSVLFLSLIGVNFIVEFAVNSVLSPIILYLVKLLFKIKK